MKKLLLLVSLLLMLCLSCTAFASGKIYRNPGYNLTFLQKINVVDIVNDTDEGRYFYPTNGAEEKALANLYESAGKVKIQLFDARRAETTKAADATALPGQKNLRSADLKLLINSMGYEIREIPGRYEEKTEYVRQYRKDRYGKETYFEVPITRQVYIPPTNVSVAVIDLIYTVTDPDTGTTVASWTDKRERNYEEEVDGMLGRSTKDFFKQLVKK